MCGIWCFFFFKQKTAYEMRISDWSSDVCSSDLVQRSGLAAFAASPAAAMIVAAKGVAAETAGSDVPAGEAATQPGKPGVDFKMPLAAQPEAPLVETLKTGPAKMRSEEHTSELQSLMRIPYGVILFKTKKTQ